MTITVALSKESTAAAAKILTRIIKDEQSKLHLLKDDSEILALEVLRNEITGEEVNLEKLRMDTAREVLLEVISHEERTGPRDHNEMVVSVASLRAIEAALEDIDWTEPKL